jgi:hypothetical protein
MKRKTFIITASTVIIGLPVAYYVNKYKNRTNPLTTPDLLGNFCNEKTLREIGVIYRTLVPEENEKQKLTDLILSGNNSKKVKTSEWSIIEKIVSKKTQEDFLIYRTIILQGWVISITEARQCALLSLT